MRGLASAFGMLALAPLLASSSAHGAPLAWVTPLAEGERVAPNATFEVALVRQYQYRLHPVGKLELSGAAARPASDEWFVPVRVRAPASGKHTVTARAGDEVVQLSFEVGPLPELALRVQPGEATKVDGKVPPVRVLVEGSAAGMAPRLSTSTGQLGPLVQEAPGRWSAPFAAGPARFPEVVVITAARPWPDEGSPAFALAHAVLPLSSAIVLPGETRPAVEVRVDIAGQSFGPVRSDERGRFDIPVVVPPGVGMATGTSIDRLGTRRVTPIDLHLPPTNRIAAAAFPTELVAGEDAEASIAVVVVDKAGGPGRDTPTLKARRGKVGELRAQKGGRFVARYTPPATPGPDVVEARLADRSFAEVTLSIRAGPPVRLDTAIVPSLLPAPSTAQALLKVVARDARGTEVPDALVAVTARRGGSATVVGPQGRELRYLPPASASPWTDTVTVRARSSAGTLASSVALAPRADGSRALLAVDAAGRPVPGAPARVATGGLLRADGEGFLPVPVSVGRFSFVLEGSALPSPVLIGRAPDGSLHGWPSHPGVRTAALVVDLMEPVPVDVRVARSPEGGVQWQVLGGGEGERRVAVSLPGRPARAGGRVGTLPLSTEERALPVTVTDLDSGVSAVLTP